MDNNGKHIRAMQKNWLDKKIWREINDILSLYEFSWDANGGKLVAMILFPLLVILSFLSISIKYIETAKIKLIEILIEISLNRLILHLLFFGHKLNSV